jgi:NADH-quinone oxidoreductase subunit C
VNAEFIARLQEGLRPLAGEATIAHGVIVFTIGQPEALLPIVRKLKGEHAFDLFLDVTAVDWLPQAPRFEVVWHFYSTTEHVRARLKARVPEDDPTVDSLAPLYGAARFMERECHDMYGIVFRNNDDLRPVLLYEGFVGHPLRKDYAKGHEQPLVPFIR